VILCADGSAAPNDLVPRLRKDCRWEINAGTSARNAPATLLITMDDWMSILFPTENRTIEDFTLLSARLRAAMSPHVVDILRTISPVVLDFPANTVRWRSWMRSLMAEANVAHELHVLDVPDVICRERLRQRNESGEHKYQVDEATFDQFMSYFVAPTRDEGFNIVVHTP
jgi:predicted kinase